MSLLPPTYDHIHDSELEDAAMQKVLQGDLEGADKLRRILANRRRESKATTKFVFAPHEATFRQFFFLTKKDSDLVFGLLETLAKNSAEDKAPD